MIATKDAAPLASNPSSASDFAELVAPALSGAARHGAGRLAHAHRRGRRRRPSAPRARPPRRRAAAARRRRAPDAPRAGTLAHDPAAAAEILDGPARSSPGPRAAARARARHPPGAAHRPRAEGGARRARRAARRSRSGSTSPSALRPAGRGRRLLPRLRGAGERRQVRRAVGRRVRSTHRGPPHTEVADDGAAGRRGAGTGLRGLADRVEALAREPAHRQPAGRGTLVRARLPLAQD